MTGSNTLVQQAYEYIMANGKLYTSYDDIATHTECERNQVANVISYMERNPRLYPNIRRVAMKQKRKLIALGDPRLVRTEPIKKVKNLLLAKAS